MTPAEFRVVREFLGLSIEWLAEHLEVNPRTVRHWEDGGYPIPDGSELRSDLGSRRHRQPTSHTCRGSPFRGHSYVMHQGRFAGTFRGACRRVAYGF
jgi:hypothetical protein